MTAYASTRGISLHLYVIDYEYDICVAAEFITNVHSVRGHMAAKKSFCLFVPRTQWLCCRPPRPFLIRDRQAAPEGHVHPSITVPPGFAQERQSEGGMVQTNRSKTPSPPPSISYPAFQPGKPGDWQCPTPSCRNHQTPGCFASAAACKQCGAPKPGAFQVKYS